MVGKSVVKALEKLGSFKPYRDLSKTWHYQPVLVKSFFNKRQCQKTPGKTLQSKVFEVVGRVWREVSSGGDNLKSQLNY